MHPVIAFDAETEGFVRGIYMSEGLVSFGLLPQTKLFRNQGSFSGKGTSTPIVEFYAPVSLWTHPLQAASRSSQTVSPSMSFNDPDAGGGSFSF